MTPSNPSNSQPLIYRIMDTLGVSHLVACINHTHEQSEVDGLQSALLSKADASSTDTKINGKISRVPTATNGNLAEFDDDGNIKDSGYKTSDFASASATATALAGKQDTLTFDNEPTANSNNPVKSKGIKAAIDSHGNVVTTTFSGTKINLFTNMFVYLGEVNTILIANSTNQTQTLEDLIYQADGVQTIIIQNGTAPANGGALIRCNYFELNNIKRLLVEYLGEVPAGV